MLCRAIPKETRDLGTKERYGFFALFVHVLGEVLTTVAELLMAVIAIDMITGESVPLATNDCVVEYLMHGLAVLVPSICLLIASLIQGGLLVER